MRPLLAVVDRTGRLVPAVREAAQQLAGSPDVLAVPRSSDFDLGGVAAHVLLLGPRELSTAGLRRAARWADEHPLAAVLAWLGPGQDTEPDLDALASAGVVAWWRGEDESELTDLLDEVLGEVLDAVAAQAPDEVPDEVHDVLADVLADEVVDAPAPAAPPSLTKGPAPSPAVPAQAPPPGAQDAPAPARPLGGPAVVLSVVGSCGGAGKTFFATNLAVALASEGRRVLLVDVDLRLGKVGAVLQARHPYSLYDGLYDAKGRALGAETLAEHLAQLVHRGPAGLDVLLAPADPTVADLLQAQDVELLLDVAADRYEVVVLDTAPGLDDITLAALDRSDLVTVLAPLDVPGLHGLTSLLDVLDRLGVDEGRRRLVLNRVDTDLGLQVAQAQEVFGDAFVAQVPADKAVPRSFNAGSALVLTEPRSAAAKALRRAFSAVLPPELVPVDEAPVPGPRDGRDTRAGLPGLLSRFSRTLSPGGTS